MKCIDYTGFSLQTVQVNIIMINTTMASRLQYIRVLGLIAEVLHSQQCNRVKTKASAVSASFAQIQRNLRRYKEQNKHTLSVASRVIDKQICADKLLNTCQLNKSCLQSVLKQQAVQTCTTSCVYLFEGVTFLQQMLYSNAQLGCCYC